MLAIVEAVRILELQTQQRHFECDIYRSVVPGVSRTFAGSGVVNVGNNVRPRRTKKVMQLNLKAGVIRSYLLSELIDFSVDKRPRNGYVFTKW